MIREYFIELDKAWKNQTDKPIPLKIIGGMALILQYDYNRVTKDADVIEAAEITEQIKKNILKIAGNGSKLHKNHRVYIEFLNEAFPFLPSHPIYHKITAINEALTNFYVEALDVADVVISKLVRFKGSDVDDISAMIEMGVVDKTNLDIRFKIAVNKWTYEARSEKLPKIIENYHTVERDMFLTAESKIELPEWI